MLKYDREGRFRILFPIDRIVEKGTSVETDDKQFIKDLKELGFEEIKTKKEGDK